MKMSAEGGLREKPRIQHVEEEIDVKKGDQVVKIAEFNREKKKKRKKMNLFKQICTWGATQ